MIGSHAKTLSDADVEESGEVKNILEQGEEVQEVLEEGREDVEEGGEVPKVPFMGLNSKLFSVPDSDLKSTSKESRALARAAI